MFPVLPSLALLQSGKVQGGMIIMKEYIGSLIHIESVENVILEELIQNQHPLESRPRGLKQQGRTHVFTCSMRAFLVNGISFFAMLIHDELQLTFPW